jgi:dihydrofolate reductase
MAKFARGTVYAQTSLDGYTARSDNRFDYFLGPEAKSGVDAHGSPLEIENETMPKADHPPSAATLPDKRFDYQAMICGVDAIVIGRATFDRTTLLLSPNCFPFTKPVYVVTSRPISKDPSSDDSPETKQQREMIKDKDVSFVTIPKDGKDEITHVQKLSQWLAEEKGHKRVHIEGGQLIQSWIRAGLIDDIVVSVAPVLIGSGYPLFGDLKHDVRMELRGTQQDPVTGMLQYRYHVTENGFDNLHKESSNRALEREEIRASEKSNG